MKGEGFRKLIGAEDAMQTESRYQDCSAGRYEEYFAALRVAGFSSGYRWSPATILSTLYLQGFCLPFAAASFTAEVVSSSKLSSRIL